MDDLKAFEEFLDKQESLEMCLSLYFTWAAIYSQSGLIVHYKAMSRAKNITMEYKQSMAV